MKSIIIGWGLFLERLPIWVLLLSAFLAGRSPDLALVLFLLCLSWYSLGAGVVATAWMALYAKIFSPEKRELFLGTTLFSGAGMGVLGSAVSAWLLESHVFPSSFVVLFAIAAIFMTLNWFFLPLTREPKLETDTPNLDWRAYKKGLFQILKTDHNFRRFLF